MKDEPKQGLWRAIATDPQGTTGFYVAKGNDQVWPAFSRCFPLIQTKEVWEAISGTWMLS